MTNDIHIYDTRKYTARPTFIRSIMFHEDLVALKIIN